MAKAKTHTTPIVEAVTPTTYTQRKRIPYSDALALFSLIQDGKPDFLLESMSISERYGRLSLAGTSPTLELVGRESDCTLRLLHSRARFYYDALTQAFAPYITAQTDTEVHFHIPKAPFNGEENRRFERLNIAQLIRDALRRFHQSERTLMGWYGALSYRFTYLFEDLERRLADETPDFHLFLYDTFLFFNHLTQEAEAVAIRHSADEAQEGVNELLLRLDSGKATPEGAIALHNIEITPNEAVFREHVEAARDLCRRGELMEIVLSRRTDADFVGDPLDLYRRYRKINPAPYLFYFRFGEGDAAGRLIGASPEMMLRTENGRVQLRPISGTAPRGANAIEDHANMMALLVSVKEKAELDMLVDLGRNDLARICKPGVKIEDYRYVEKYSHVMHTVAQLSGELQDDVLGIDALIAALPAGTLAGAPKPAAMRYIEEMELKPRGWYGGSVGYMSFSGEVDTGIIIRTAYIEKGKLVYNSGATLLYDSTPEGELKETDIKAAAFHRIFTNP